VTVNGIPLADLLKAYHDAKARQTKSDSNSEIP